MVTAAPLTKLFRDTETSVLTTLHGMLDSQSIQTRDQFIDMMNAAFKYGGLNYRELADDLGYSPTSVYRWIQGKSAPHPSLFASAQNWIVKRVADKIT